MEAPFNSKKYMLWGDNLRMLLNSEHITYGEINETLKEKGIFIGSTEKSVTVPLLSSTLLTPEQFTKLIKESFTRESIKKYKQHKIILTDIDSDWSAAVVGIFDSSELVEYPLDGDTQFSTSPEVIVHSATKIEIPYRIKRTDYSKDFIQREIEFDGSITITQKNGELSLDFNSTHTSRETDKVNEFIVKRISKSCKSLGITVNEEPSTIKFEDFSNPDRVLFFMKLTSTPSKPLSFDQVIDLEIVRDITAGPLPNDPEIKWMEGTVRRIKIDGEKLNNLFLLKTMNYYNFYFITKMNVEYSFNIGANTGRATISFTFGGRHSKEKNDLTGTEFSFSIEKIFNDHASASKARTAAKKIAKKAVEAEIKDKLRNLVGDLRDKAFSEVTSSSNTQTDL